MSKGELQRKSDELAEQSAGIFFEVSLYYYRIVPDCISIEFYELEGDNISRDELEVLFGEEQLKELEFIL